MAYGETFIAGERLSSGTSAVIGDDGRLYQWEWPRDADLQHAGTMLVDVEEGQAVRLDPPPGFFRKVVEPG